MKKLLLKFSFFLCFSTILQAQTIEKDYAQYGTVLRLQIKNSLFPDTLRDTGHQYNGKTYPFLEHYADSTVLVFIPKYFKAGKKTDVVVFFHGWSTTVDRVAQVFQLIAQFDSAKRNAILVIPQGPKNAPDSYGGKLEREGGFKLFINEILTELKNRKITPSVNSGNLVISGHSGAYRVMAHILLHGGLPVQEVFLFDGLYGQIEKFGHWLTHTKGRFINIYTTDGGTFQESKNLIMDLKAWNIPFLATEDSKLTDEMLKYNRILMIYTPLTHNQVIHVNQHFYRFLKLSSSISVNKRGKY
jgi:hypothetical protein